MPTASLPHKLLAALRGEKSGRASDIAGLPCGQQYAVAGL